MIFNPKWSFEYSIGLYIRIQIYSNLICLCWLSHFMPSAKILVAIEGGGVGGGGQLGNTRLLELGASKRATLFWHWRPTLCHMVCFLYFFTMLVQYLFLRLLLYLFLVTLTRQFVCRLVCFLPEWHSQVSPPATEPPSYVSQTKHFGDQMDHFKYMFRRSAGWLHTICWGA